jgi:T5SS/PEP-CTERM-associated repeat protein
MRDTDLDVFALVGTQPCRGVPAYPGNGRLHRWRSRGHACCLLTLLAAMLALFPTAPVRAEVVAAGDVTPNTDPDLPVFGGTATSAVIVGVTDTGLLTIDVPAFTLPLVSPGGTIGQESTAIGEAVVTGFNSEWDTQGELIIGDLGIGFLKAIGGARVLGSDEIDDGGTPDDPSDDTIITPGSVVIGSQVGSQGYVTIDGFGSRLDTPSFIIADEGFGVMNVSDRGSVLTYGDAEIGVTPSPAWAHAGSYQTERARPVWSSAPTKRVSAVAIAAWRLPTRRLSRLMELSKSIRAAESNWPEEPCGRSPVR